MIFLHIIDLLWSQVMESLNTFWIYVYIYSQTATAIFLSEAHGLWLWTLTYSVRICIFFFFMSYKLWCKCGCTNWNDDVKLGVCPNLEMCGFNHQRRRNNSILTSEVTMRNIIEFGIIFCRTAPVGATDRVTWLSSSKIGCEEAFTVLNSDFPCIAIFR